MRAENRMTSLEGSLKVYGFISSKVVWSRERRLEAVLVFAFFSCRGNFFLKAKDPILVWGGGKKGHSLGDAQD